jgi:hypothetical protein
MFERLVYLLASGLAFDNRDSVDKRINHLLATHELTITEEEREALTEFIVTCSNFKDLHSTPLKLENQIPWYSLTTSNS